MAECVLCGRRDAGTAYACVGCARPVQRALEGLAQLAPELDVTIARQGRTGDGGRGGDDQPLPVNLDASRDAWAVVNTVATWARHCEERRGRHAPIVGERDHQALAAVAAWLATQVEWLRHQPEAQQALDELADACAVAVRTVDRRAPRWYAGPCTAHVAVDGHGTITISDDGAACGADLYAHAGAQVVRCRRCGSEYDAATRREQLLAAARDTLVHAELLARAVTALGVRGVDDRPVTPAMVRGMAWRGRLEVRGHDQAGRALYRVGDIINRVDEQRIAAARRADVKPATRRKVEGSAA